MKRKPPILLIIVAVAYLAYLAWMLSVNFTPIIAGRFAISAILFVFVFRGSRLAGNILGILFGLSALVLLVAAIATFNKSAIGAALFTLIAGLLGAFAAYLFFSPAIRAFQGKPPEASSQER